MFGFSFGELVVLMIVGVVVIGPKDLPRVLRKAGQWAGKLRRMASELRAQSGIDEVLRAEGLSDDINEIRKLARGELDQVVRAARVDNAVTLAQGAGAGASRPGGADPYAKDDLIVDRTREYPVEGADSYGALPDQAVVYANALVPSALADDPLYAHGDRDPSAPLAPGSTLDPGPLPEAPPAVPAPAPRPRTPPPRPSTP